MVLRADAGFNDQVVALEPRYDSLTYRTSNWPSHQFTSVCDVRLINNTSTLIQVPKNDHLCQIRATHSIDVSVENSTVKPKKTLVRLSPPYSEGVVIDPSNQLSSEWKRSPF